MYNPLDQTNIEMLHNGFPEDSAIYNPVKGELTCFYNNEIAAVFKAFAKSTAIEALDTWLDREDR
jgi:hypothetical protein|tara:strand:+ start:192 stop:386 length:195 start_codon:yes stop_codon:yes gene_type:complete